MLAEAWNLRASIQKGPPPHPLPSGPIPFSGFGHRKLTWR